MHRAEQLSQLYCQQTMFSAATSGDITTHNSLYIQLSPTALQAIRLSSCIVYIIKWLQDATRKYHVMAVLSNIRGWGAVRAVRGQPHPKFVRTISILYSFSSARRKEHNGGQILGVEGQLGEIRRPIVFT